MATGVGTGFDISKMLDSITNAEKAISNLMNKSNEASRSIINAFQQMSSQGVLPYVQSLEKQISIYGAVREAITDTTGKAKSHFGDMKREVDKVINSLTTMSQALYKTEAYRLGVEQVDDAERYSMWLRIKHREAEEHKRIEEEKAQATKEAIDKQNEEYEAAARRKKEIEEQNSKAQLNSANASEAYRQQLRMYEQMFDQIAEKEKKARKEASDYETRLYEDNLTKYKKHKDEQARVDKHYHDKRQKELEDMFAAIERTQKRERALMNAKGDTSKGALNYYNRMYSDKGVLSIQNMQTALSKLRDAQSRLDLSTENGKKRYKELGDAINRVEKDMKKYSSSANDVNEKHKNLLNTGDQLKRALTAIFSVSAIKGYINKLVEVRGEFEMQHKSLQVLIQDVDKANKLWDKTVALAVKSPFRVKDLVTYTKQLAAYRVETDKLYDTTKMLADVSSGLGVDMNRLILAYGQVKAANFLRGTELRQFTEAGIPMLDELAKYFTEMENRFVSAADVFARISKRGVSFEDVDAVFKRITGEGGVFYKMQEQQSETLKGMINNLRDSIDLMLNDIGTSQEETLKGLISTTKGVVDNWRAVGVAIKQATTAIAIVGLKNFVVGWRAVSASTFAGTAAMTGAAKGAATLRLALGKLFATMQKNPWMFVIGAAISATHAILNYNKALKETNKKYDEASASEMRRIDNLKEIGAKVEDNNAIISDSTSTQEKQNAAIASNKSILEQLKKEYPNIYSAIKTQESGTIDLTDAIKLQNDELRANIALQQQAKGKFFQKSQAENYKDVIEAQSKLQSSIYDTQGAAITMGSKLEYAIQQGKVSEEDAKGIKDYIEAIKNAQNFDEIQNAFLNKDIVGKISPIVAWKIGLRHVADAYYDALEANGKYERAVLNFQATLDNQMSTFSVELNKMESTFKEGISDEEKELARGEWLQTQLDNLGILDKEIRKWSNDYIVNKIGLKIEFPDPSQETKNLKAWQETYNKRFGISDDASTEGVDESFFGFKKIQNAARKQSEEVERLQGEYSDLKKIIDAIYKAGGKKATQAGGAYEGENLESLKERQRDVMAQLDFFGADYEKKKKNTDNEALQRLKKQIQLIREAARAYDDMRKLHDKAYADKQIKSEYGAAFKEAKLGDISGYAFGTRQDEQNNLEKLRSSAEKTTGGVLELNKALAQVGVNIDDANQEVTDKELFDSISDIFSNYEISLEMDKLNIPKDLASKLFGFDAIDLDDIRGQVLGKFDMGSMEGQSNEQIYASDAFQNLSKERQEELRKSLEKEEQLQNEYLEKNLKKYIEYTRVALGERAKIKVDEINQLNEIEKTFKPISEDTAKNEEELKQIREKNKLLMEQGAIARSAVKEKSSQQIKQIEWDEFRSSEVYMNLFKDLDKASDDVINKAIARIEEFKKEWKDMPVQAAKEMFAKMTELQDSLYDTTRVRRDKRSIEGTLDYEIDKRGLKRKSTTQEGRDELRSALMSENVDYQSVIDYETQRVAILELINSQTQKLTATDLERLGYTQQQLEYYGISNKELENSVKENNKLITASKDNVKSTNQLIDNNNRLYKLIDKQELKTKEIRERWIECLNASNNLLESFSDLGDSIDAAFGTDIIDDTVSEFVQMGTSMLSAVANAISLQVQLAGVEAGALAAGTAMNSMLGIIGWIVMAVQLLASLFTAIANIDAKKREKEREKEIEKAEKLKNEYEDLVCQFERYEKAFNRISDAFDKAYTLEQKRAGRVAGKQNLEEQRRLLDEQERVNKERISHLQSANAAEQELKDSKQDKEYIENNNREINELIRQQDEINDNRRELLEAEKEWEQAFNESFGGTYDYATIADEWVDAWLQAFKESGNGLEALEDKFDDFMTNLIKKQVVYKGASKIMENLMSVINDAIGDSGVITESEWSQIMQESENTFEDLDNFLTRYSDMLHRIGIDLQSKEGTISGLQKGIQGITEDQADVLSSYWNTVRFDVSAIRRMFENYVSAEDETYTSPMISYLSSISKQTNSILKLLDNAVGNNIASNAINVRVLEMP